MRLIAILGLLAAAGCSADTDAPPYVPPNDGAYDSGQYDDEDDSPADDPNDATNDDDPADPQDNVTVPPEGTGPAHHGEVEPNDDVFHPTYIGTPNCSADAKLEGTDDNDWFSVSIEQAGPYVFSTTTGEPDDNEATDTRLEVYGRDDLATPVASDDDAGEGPAARLTVELQPATYYIRVIGYTTATVGEYAIHVVHPEDEGTVGGDGTDDPEPIVIPPAQEVETESNGTLQSADSLGTAPWTIAASLDARDTDYFVFQIDAAQTITAETGPIDDGDASVDTIIDLLDVDGQTLGSDDDGADVELFSRLSLDLPGPGTYYVRVTGYGDDTHGSYSLSIQ